MVNLSHDKNTKYIINPQSIFYNILEVRVLPRHPSEYLFIVKHLVWLMAKCQLNTQVKRESLSGWKGFSQHLGIPLGLSRR